MDSVRANIYNELEKLFAKRMTKVFLVAAGLLPFIVKLLVNKMFFTDWMALPSLNINFMILDLLIKVMLPLFSFIAAAELFTGEGERGTLLLIRPINRIELFISKTAAISLLIALQLLMAWLAVSISSIIFDQSYRFSDIGLSLSAFLVSWLPLIVLTALAVLLALLLKSSVVTVSTLIIVYIVMVFVPYVFPSVLYLLPSAYLDWYMQWIGDVSIRWALQTLTYLFSSAALFLASGYYIFQKKEA
ncbi:ABC transporter permease subunit [Bacillus sp. DNRA2]|uniref:ABC transporter permease n=1 Tax=Bacillus sp. DNRA2 TaxID=2723053 RepID=UPI00145E5F6D|nr:ABC transporter permease [Bacillus sp. DNRA2]NMD69722.1 ABC transporter permease subunit [Bacillus sp. DNRA2]